MSHPDSVDIVSHMRFRAALPESRIGFGGREEVHRMIGPSVDAGQATVEKLLNVGIRLEAAASCFYAELAERFAHCLEVAEFWRVMAADEACHEDRLIQWQRSSIIERLSQPVDGQMLQKAERLFGTGVDEMLDGVHNLDDAYEMAHDLESSEINTIFRFFIAEFSQDARVLGVLMQDLDEHAERLMAGFPSRYATRGARAAVEASRL
jgi:rubrerythrin